MRFARSSNSGSLKNKVKRLKVKKGVLAINLFRSAGVATSTRQVNINIRYRRRRRRHHHHHHHHHRVYSQPMAERIHPQLLLSLTKF